MTLPLCSRAVATLFTAVCWISLVLPAQGSRNLWSLFPGGCPVAGGVRPILGPTSPPVIGNSKFAIAATALRPGARAYLVIALGPQMIPFFGCRILNPANIALVSPMTRVGPMDAELPIPIPELKSLLGAQAFFQVLVLQGTQFAASPGLQITISEAHREYGSIATLTGSPGRLRSIYFNRNGSHSEKKLPASLSLLPISRSGFDRVGRRVKPQDDRRVYEDATDPSAQYIALRDVGRLYRYRDDAGTVGIFVAKKDAALMAPVLAAGNYAESVGVSDDGRLIAVVNRGGGSGDRVLLARTDGTPLTGTKTSVDITPAKPKVAVVPESLTFAGGRVFFAGANGNASWIYHAPDDGSRAATLLPIAALGNGTWASTVDAPFLASRAGTFAVVARNGSHSDVIVVEPNASGASVRNVTMFAARPPVAVESFGLSVDAPHRAAISASGQLVAFTAKVGASREAFLVPTDGSRKRAVLGTELSGDRYLPSRWTEVQRLHMVSDRELVLFAGQDARALDLIHYELKSDGSLAVATWRNLSATSGQRTPPFTRDGTLSVGSTYASARSLLFERINASSRDVVAVELVSLQLSSVTGTEFSRSPVPSLRTLDRIATTSAHDGGEPTVVLGTTESGHLVVAAFDAANLGAGVSLLDKKPPGFTPGDVVIEPDTQQCVGYYDPVLGIKTEIGTYDLPNRKAGRSFTVPGIIRRGSLHYVNDVDPTLVYAVGTNHPRFPTDATLVHMSLRTGESVVVNPVRGTQIVTATTDRPATIDPRGCRWIGNIDFTCFCVLKESYMVVTIEAEIDTDEDIRVWIEGEGPRFCDDTIEKIVKCKTGATRFCVKANNTPGCFAVCLNEMVFFKRLNVIKATPTFRNAGKLSGDNQFPARPRCKDDSLGVGTQCYGPGGFQNTMELCFQLEPKDACFCRFDIGRTKACKLYLNGALVGGIIGGDDSTNTDEDLRPSKAGNIYSMDAPGFSSLPNAANGTVLEQHCNFTEVLWIENKGRLERCSKSIPWQTHLVLRRAGGSWSVDQDKSEIEQGHGDLSSRR